MTVRASSSGTGSVDGAAAAQRGRRVVVETATAGIRGAGSVTGIGEPLVRSPVERVLVGWRSRLAAAWSPCGDWLARYWVWLALGLVVCVCWDRAAYLYLAEGARLGDPAKMVEAKRVLEARWWMAFLKNLGELTWIAVCLPPVLMLRDWAHFASQRRATAGRVFRRAVFVLLSAALAGGLAEVLKLLTRRLRPSAALDEAMVGGWFAFRPWWERPLSAENLGFASSHAAVAFGAAIALGVIWPRARWALLMLAMGTGLARMLVGAHFLSDVFAAGVLGWLAVVYVRELDRLNNHGVGVESHMSLVGGTGRGSVAA